MKISRETLHQLIENKLCQAGLKREHAATVAEVLVYADARGIHSHGAVRVEYYAAVSYTHLTLPTTSRV